MSTVHKWYTENHSNDKNILCSSMSQLCTCNRLMVGHISNTRLLLTQTFASYICVLTFNILRGCVFMQHV